MKYTHVSLHICIYVLEHVENEEVLENKRKEP